MREVAVVVLGWRWWCLLWLCLAAARVATTPVTAAPGQGKCEVLDLSQQSTYLLPTNLTVKPTSPRWLLDLALQKREESPAACVRIEHKQSRVRILLYKGDCNDGNLMDYNFLNDRSVLPHAWTSLALDVKTNTVLVTGQGGDPITLTDHSSSLPCNALHVTTVKNAEAAVGCRVNCPQYKYASEGPDKKTTVIESQQNNILFYFRPSQEFVRLEYEVSCTTTLGHTVFVHFTDIVPPDHLPRGLWHLVELQHLNGVAEVRLNYRLLKRDKLQQSCTFKEHAIKVVGVSLFTFSCNPSSGVAEWVDDGIGKCSSSTDDLLILPMTAAALAVVVETLLLVVVYAVVTTLKNTRQRFSYIKQTDNG